MKDKQEEQSGGSYKIKGAAESVKQEIKDLDKMPGDVKQMDTPPARKKGAAASKPDANGDGIPDYAQDGIGASRMGFTQNFGAARQNSYAQGAAKVASIMSFGASKKKGAADHIAGHLEEFTGSAPNTSGIEQNSDVVNEGLSIKEQRLNNQIAGIQKLRNMKTRDSSLVDMSSPSKAKQMFNFTFSPDRNSVNAGGIIRYNAPKSQGGGNERVYESTSESAIRRNFPEKNLTGEYYNTEQADQIIKYQAKLKENANKLK
jgi:hypothetical protein